MELSLDANLKIDKPIPFPKYSKLAFVHFHIQYWGPDLSSETPMDFVSKGEPDLSHFKWFMNQLIFQAWGLQNPFTLKK